MRDQVLPIAAQEAMIARSEPTDADHTPILNRADALVEILEGIAARYPG
jgi:hypothetical protein